jgi:UDP-GlcNAc3NAcA epimerase
MRIVTIIGARPQFIKAAMISHVLAKLNGINEVIVHTGQHYDRNMSCTFFEELNIPVPKHNLGINQGMHGKMTGRMLEAIEQVLEVEKPDWVLVYGDTNSTLAGALASAKLKIPVAHVEAGLRSFNKHMPEEINRVLTDHISSILFCPTINAVEQLRHEGFTSIANNGDFINLESDVDFSNLFIQGKSQIVANVGDVMYDAINHCKSQMGNRNKVLSKLKVKKNEFVLATIHRPENTDVPENLEHLIENLADLAKDIDVVFPLHPRTRERLRMQGLLGRIKTSKGMCVIEPVSYADSIGLEQNALAIITDSGGVQKEAYILGTPCFTVRDETEWVETVDNGWNCLVGSRPQNMKKLIMGKARPSGTRNQVYGNGTAAATIVKILHDIQSCRSNVQMSERGCSRIFRRPK